MKKLISTSLFLFIILQASISFGQGLRVSSLAEKTVMGLQVGTEVSYLPNQGLTFGGFYQRNIRGANEIGQQIYEYMGGMVSFPLTRCDRLRLNAVLRGGLSNRRFVIVTPGLETELKISKLFSFNFGMAFRAGEAATSIKLTLTL
ncbi:hypothetical protein SAMN04488029_2641 [Reichenbachiella faecimaris]|uniref:PorT family protein n=1 Tax=Reichenbachiella faecimaris TaxID=692418 RepID=A0A1W2GH40_REIFA|nr:hypothetical protein [Reichenbachiella faecimaris]SMD35983.1 hypothetical protein SAMN04488029_2641 [Reichenbachiella faecimaris]